MEPPARGYPSPETALSGSLDDAMHLVLVSPRPLTGDPLDTNPGDVTGRRVRHRREGHPRPDIGVREALQQLRRTALGDPARP